MLTTFETTEAIRQLKFDSEDLLRLKSYQTYRDLYRSDFSQPFAGVISKIRQRYPLDNTTAQTLIEVNLFRALTDFFKFLTTNNDFKIETNYQDVWDKLALENSFISVLKEVCIDNSRFGNGLFKVAVSEDKVKLFSICPDCWFPVFKNGNLNELEGHILLYDIIKDGKIYKHIEKIHKGFIENEVWLFANGSLTYPVDVSEFDLKEIDDFSEKWDDFVLFPVKNSCESDCYYGESDYKSCLSIVEEIMLTISQNSKIINRHANPKMAGSIENTQINPMTGERYVPNTDFYTVGKDGSKPEYITADLQADAIKAHIDTLMQFFYILTKTPPQAYGVDISGNMSGESLQRIFMSAVAKVEDIRTVSLNNAIKNVVKCALAFSGYKEADVSIDWGSAIKLDYTEIVKSCNDRVLAGTQSKLSAIMQMDNYTDKQAQEELTQIQAEQREEAAPAVEDILVND